MRFRLPDRHGHTRAADRQTEPSASLGIRSARLYVVQPACAVRGSARPGGGGTGGPVAALRDLISTHAPLALALGGLVIGMAFGAIVVRTNFCAMGSISDMVAFGDARRFRAWLLAAATALAGAQALDWAGLVSLSRSMYLGANVSWVGHILGGLMFGYGMVFAGGCASRNLARIGSGDLRALLTLIVMGVFAYITIGGLIGPLRDLMERTTAWRTGARTQGLGELLAPVSPFGAGALTIGVTALVVAAVLIYCFKDKAFRSSRTHVLSGLGIGLCATAGWLLTGLAFDDLADKPQAPISLTFVRPVGDTIEWLERFTAAMVPGFGVATVIGVVVGAFLAARLSGKFRLQTFSDLADTRRSLYGAMLMGVGGILALGCTMGQAITGVSTLALGSFLTFPALVAGGVLGVKRLEQIMMAEA
jgi:hypothetical protein